jgi:hypothetical protein
LKFQRLSDKAVEVIVGVVVVGVGVINTDRALVGIKAEVVVADRTVRRRKKICFIILL